MPSFDAVSQVNMAELDNALAQAKKELESRYDLKGAKTGIEKQTKNNEIMLKADTEDHIATVRELFLGKVAKRGISLRNVDFGKVEASGVQLYKQVITIREGIEVERAKKLIALLKDSKLKVQGSIQGDTIRVSGKNRDDLQSAMALMRGQEDVIEVALQFTNFRD